MQTVDLLLTGAKVLNVYTREFTTTNVWIDGDKIVSVLPDADLKARTTVDLQGKWLVPGFIDAHVHIESALVTPSEIGKILLQHGVTTVVADPHELGNVAGTAGIEYLIHDSRQTPLDVRYMLPSSVPCVPFDHNGATLHAADLEPLYAEPEVNGLAEVMDYGAVERGDKDTMDKVHAAYPHGYHADGHGAGLSARQLEVMAAAGMDTDHECTSVKEAQERVNAGMHVFLREGTVERDLLNTVGAVTESNAAQFAFCTDDKTIGDLIKEGSIDRNLRMAIAAGLRPEIAYAMASYHAALAHKLSDRGSISAGKLADLVVIDDLADVHISRVMKSGAWQDEETASKPLPFTATHLQHHLQLADLRMPLEGTVDANIIGVQPNHITTDHVVQSVTGVQGEFQPDFDRDILKMVVVERHHNTGCVGLGLVQGFKLKHGAVASSVAHDAHNIVAVGSSDAAIMQAIMAITATDGGQAVATDKEVLANVPLPIGGLLSDQPYRVVAKQMAALRTAYNQVSVDVDYDPFITLSFLTLPVIPTLKLTDQGLFDFDTFSFVPVFKEAKVAQAAGNRQN